MQRLTELKITPTVQGILASRIDRLPAEEKELLQILAVIGKEFPLTLIKRLINPMQPGTESSSSARAAEQASEKLERMLSHLQLGEFIYEQATAIDIVYSFKHALTQDVAYSSVLMERRRLLHARTGEAIEEVYQDRIDDHLTELAHHYRRSPNAPKAVKYLYLAGPQAPGRSAHARAPAYFAPAPRLLDSFPPGGERVPLEVLMPIGYGLSLRLTTGVTAPDDARPRCNA